MSRFVIEGGRPLSGEITASGNKNAVLPMIAAALLTDEEVVLENAPQIRDVGSMLELLDALGVSVSQEGETLRIRAEHVAADELPRALCEEIRTSILLVAPLLARRDHVKLHPPGGDLIGRRRLDAHFYGLRSLGVEVEEDALEFRKKGRMHGATLFFDEASVTATEHILMAAVLADGETKILNAASEPHVQDLVKMLVAMGADIDGAGTNALTIRGVEKLCGVRHRVVSDHIEVGSYLALAAATGGSITVHGTTRSHHWMTHRVFERFSLPLELGADFVRLPPGHRAKIVPDAGGQVPRVDDGPWPQLASDLMSPLLVLATQTEGTVLFFEKMFESRMYFVDSLIQMGANIIACDPHRVVIMGPSALRGQTLRSPDIRAGMALLIAALCAHHRPSIVQNAHVIDRGYERVEEKLRALGARIEREDD